MTKRDNLYFGLLLCIRVKNMIYVHEYSSVLVDIILIVTLCYHADDELIVTVDSNSSLPLT